MKRIHIISVIVLMLSFFASCENFMDVHKEWIKDGEMIYPPRVDSLSFIAGRERLEFRFWLYKSPNVRKVNLYWNDRSDSLIIPVTPSAGLDSVFVIVPKMAERSYTFDIRTTDMYGHKSLFMTGFGTAYGANYEESLNDRNIANFDLKVQNVTCTKDYVFETGTVTVSWICERNVTGISAKLLSAGTGMVRTEYRYKTKYGNDTIVKASGSANSIELRNAILSSEAVPSYLYSRSAFIPEKEAIDTFFTAYKNENWKRHTFPLPPKPDQEPGPPDPPKPKPGYGMYDRSDWVVLQVSDETPWDGGGMHTLFDNKHDNWWHSMWHDGNAPCPHWAIIDMKEDKNFGKFVVYRRPDNPDTKTVEFYVSNSPDPNGSWRRIAVGMFPKYSPNNDSRNNAPIEIIVLDNAKGRYLKMNLPDTYRDPFTSVAEVYAYPPLSRYDRSAWEVLEVSDETPWDGGGMHKLLDGDPGSYWHSMWHDGNAPCPHWAVIDMKESLDIGKIEVYRRKDNTDTKTVEVYLSDSPNPNGSWKRIGEGIYPNTKNDLLEFLTNDKVKGRYLKMVLPDSHRDPFTSIAEIYPHGYILK